MGDRMHLKEDLSTAFDINVSQGKHVKFWITFNLEMYHLSWHRDSDA